MVEQQAEILEELGLIDSEEFNSDGFILDSELETALEEPTEPVKEKAPAKVYTPPKTTYENIPPAERNQEELYG